MDELTQSKRAGAKIFRDAIKYIKVYGWHHNSMDTLLATTPGKKWEQPMAVLMFGELSNELGSETLSAFDKRVSDAKEVVALFRRVAISLTTSK